MKKYILLPVLATLALSGNMAVAQDFDTNPVIKIDNKEESLRFTVGARFMADAAYYNSDFTPVKSGVAITDARIRTSMTYKDWYFYADFDFSKGKFSQKNIFLQYSFNNDELNHHVIKAGYFNNPATMGNCTSRGSLHFISRSSAVNALAPGRELGVAYKFYNDKFFAYQGVFAENKYNDQISGYQGIAAGGRWLYMPINNDENTLHIGASFRYSNIRTGEVTNNVMKTNLELGSSLETYVDPTTQFLSASLPWAKNVFNVGAEALYRTDKFFARGEYLFKHVTKERDDKTLFLNQLGGAFSWTTLESWQKGNPLGANSFHGGYLEAGYQIFGKGYKYDKAEGLLGGLGGQSLEVVARYSYTGLNDIVAGEFYVPGRDQYYPNGVIADYPATSKSVGGGNMHSVTLGANYAFNKFAQVMLDYTYNKLSRDKFGYDKNFHVLQARLMFSF
ncbi:MAG: porin [Muribaculaceae bacterium]